MRRGTRVGREASTTEMPISGVVALLQGASWNALRYVADVGVSDDEAWRTFVGM